MSVQSREGGVLQLWKDVGEDQHGQAPTNLWRTAVEGGHSPSGVKRPFWIGFG